MPTHEELVAQMLRERDEAERILAGYKKNRAPALRTGTVEVVTVRTNAEMAPMTERK